MNKRDCLQLIENLVLSQCDKMNSFIDDPQQRIYTVPRLE